MKKLILATVFLLSSLAVTAQTSEPKRVADETFIKVSKTSFKVLTANERVFKALLAKFPIKRFTTVKKVDRVGEYWEKEIPFKLEELTKVETYLKTL